MSISPNTLAQQTLIACDASYFINVATSERFSPTDDTNPKEVYVGDALTPLIDTNPSYPPQFIPLSPNSSNPDPTEGYVVVAEGDDSQTTRNGGKFLAFRNENYEQCNSGLWGDRRTECD